MAWAEMVWPILLATLLGTFIGFEREIHGHPAGLRTHILVSLGAAIAALVSIQLGGGNGDPGRVAAQVVTGVGFLGAGAIIREGASIRGLTTAASIWTTAMVGLAVGIGGRSAVLACFATCLILAVLWWLHYLEALLERHGIRGSVLEVETTGDSSLTPRIVQCIAEHGATIRAFEIRGNRADDRRNLRITIKAPGGADANALIAAVAALPDVRSVSVG
jgi:putative Mg2+ transporter-C (MgtC) family protein